MRKMSCRRTSKASFSGWLKKMAINHLVIVWFGRVVLSTKKNSRLKFASAVRSWGVGKARPKKRLSRWRRKKPFIRSEEPSGNEFLECNILLYGYRGILISY